MSRAKKTPPLIDLQCELIEAQADVDMYQSVLIELDRLSELYPTVNRDYIARTILSKYCLEVEWFRDIQDHHRQSLSDNINPKPSPRKKL